MTPIMMTMRKNMAKTISISEKPLALLEVLNFEF